LRLTGLSYGHRAKNFLHGITLPEVDDKSLDYLTDPLYPDEAYF
jgi:hypothetical protein